jgi:hypothetical protein
VGSPTEHLTRIDAWRDRVNTLARAIERVGRADLSVAFTPVDRLMSIAAERPAAAEEAFASLSKLLLEIRAGVAERGRALDRRVLDEAQATIARLESARDEWASAVLDGLGSAADDDLGAFAESVSSMRRAPARDELGTLREPLASGRKSSPDVPGPRVLMKGELGPGLLADLVQLFAQNAETGLFVIETKDGPASIYFRAGAVIDAECGDDVGERAFFRVMAIRQGRFSYQRGIEAENDRIRRSAQHLIMESLRLMDEGGKAADEHE